MEGLELVDEAYEAKMAGFEIDCNNKDSKSEASACHHTGEFYSVIKEDYKKSAAIYQENCKNKNYAPSCFNLGKLYLSGKSVEQSDEIAVSYFDKACQQGHWVACYHQGAMSFLTGKENKDTQELNKGIDLLEKACSKGQADSCAILSEHFIKAGSEYRNPSRAIAPLQSACEFHHAASCYNLAVLYKKGDTDILPNKELHLKYKKRTLELREQLGSLGGRKTG